MPDADARGSGRPVGCSRWWARRADWDRASRRAAADRTMHDDGDDDGGRVHAYGRGHDAPAALPAALCVAAAAEVPHKPENVHQSARPTLWHLKNRKEKKDRENENSLNTH